MTEIPFDSLGPAYAFLDPHGGKTQAIKTVSSRAAIVVARADSRLPRYFCVYAWAKRVPTHVLMDKILEVNDRFRPRKFGVEANGLAGLWGDALSRDVEFRTRQVPLAKVEQPTTVDKIYRIRTALQDVIAKGRLFLLGGDPGMMELENEIATFPMNPRMDMIDALASLIRLMPKMPARREFDRELEQKLAYLRNSGADPEYIERVARTGHL